MRVERTAIEDVLILVPRRFDDPRGHFTETYNKDTFADLGITAGFVQDNASFSPVAGTVRGLHYQAPPFAQTKLVRCSRGAIVDVAVDIRAGSPTFGLHVKCILTAENMRQLYIPAGFAHGFSTLSADTEVHYKVDALYAPGHERGILFNDPALGIDWQLDCNTPILSEKDRQLPVLGLLQSEFSYEKHARRTECVS